jgi:hypothetical protein
MAKVMQPHALKSGRGPHSAPYLVEAGERAAGAMSANHIRIAELAGQIRQYSERRRVEIDRLLSGLAVGQENHRPFEVDPFPMQAEDFRTSAAGEEQKPDPCGVIWIVRRLGFCVERLAQARNLRFRQKPFHAPRRRLPHPMYRIGVEQLALNREGHYGAQHRYGLRRRAASAPAEVATTPLLRYRRCWCGLPLPRAASVPHRRG